MPLTSFSSRGLVLDPDCVKIKRPIYEVDFRGAVIADHVPSMVGGPRTGWAYSIGYIKALLAAVGAP